MKIEKNEHRTKIDVGCGIVTICNSSKGLSQLQIEDEHGEEAYVDLSHNEIDAIIEALQTAKSYSHGK